MIFEAEYLSITIAHDIGMPDYDETSVEKYPGVSKAFRLLGWCFGITFWIELLMRIAAEGCKFWRDFWSYLDTVIVICWTISAVGIVMPINPLLLRLARLMRLLRLLKLVRKMQGFDALQIIATAMWGSLGSLFW